MKQEDFEILKDIGDKIANKRKENQALLDDFAKAAMQSLVGVWQDSIHAPRIVLEAYDIAQAMMNERERRIKG